MYQYEFMSICCVLFLLVCLFVFLLSRQLTKLLILDGRNWHQRRWDWLSKTLCVCLEDTAWNCWRGETRHLSHPSGVISGSQRNIGVVFASMILRNLVGHVIFHKLRRKMVNTDSSMTFSATLKTFFYIYLYWFVFVVVRIKSCIVPEAKSLMYKKKIS